MRILHTSDWHLGKRLERFSRLDEQREVLGEIAEIAQSMDADAVIVSGDLNKYLETLEVWFRENAREYHGGVSFYEKGVGKLEESMNSSYFFWSGQKYDVPFAVDEDNADQALEYMNNVLSNAKNMYKMQRINHGNLMGIIQDKKSMDTLNLTNYAHKNHVVRILPGNNTIKIQNKI